MKYTTPRPRWMSSRANQESGAWSQCTTKPVVHVTIPLARESHFYAWTIGLGEPTIRMMAASRTEVKTELKKKGKDPLLSAICHDLRAPLAAVTMGANFVLQTLEDEDDRQRKILEAMLRSCAQMERLVRNFADLSEIEGDAVNLRLGAHDAGEMVELALEAARPAAEARGVTLEMDRPATNVSVECDREHILRALHQLVDNAVKSAPERSTVTLAVQASGDDVVFCVIDHGKGLDAATKKNLFDRQWHAKRASRVGSGFGLAIARGFARAHGGDVAVDSKKGRTVAKLSLPRQL